MPRKILPVVLSESEIIRLEQWIRAGLTPQQVVLRAKIILEAARGGSDLRIARELKVQRRTAALWRHRVVEQGIGFVWEIAPGRGRKASYRSAQHHRVLCVDERSQILALDRTQPGLPLKPGRCGNPRCAARCKQPFNGIRDQILQPPFRSNLASVPLACSFRRWENAPAPAQDFRPTAQPVNQETCLPQGTHASELRHRCTPPRLPLHHVCKVSSRRRIDWRDRSSGAVFRDARRSTPTSNAVSVTESGQLLAKALKFKNPHDKTQWEKLHSLPNLIYTGGNAFSLSFADGYAQAVTFGLLMTRAKDIKLA